MNGLGVGGHRQGGVVCVKKPSRQTQRVLCVFDETQRPRAERRLRHPGLNARKAFLREKLQTTKPDARQAA